MHAPLPQHGCYFGSPAAGVPAPRCSCSAAYRQRDCEGQSGRRPEKAEDRVELWFSGRRGCSGSAGGALEVVSTFDDGQARGLGMGPYGDVVAQSYWAEMCNENAHLGFSFLVGDAHSFCTYASPLVGNIYENLQDFGYLDLYSSP